MTAMPPIPLSAVRPFSLVQVGSFGVIGDNCYRLHQPAAALARIPGLCVYEVHPQARHRDAAVLAADVVVLTMTLDLEVFRLIHQRHQLGKPTICEINDYLPDVQPWNPVNRTWGDPRARQFFDELVSRCDAVQATSEALARRLQPMARRIEVFPNQMEELPATAPMRATDDSDVVIGWGGSCGHREDLADVATCLVPWLHAHPTVRLELMADPEMAEPFQSLPSHQFRLRAAGSLEQYLSWLNEIDIGIAPLLPTAFNCCRSDVKYLEYASRCVAPVLQRLDPYLHLEGRGTALLFETHHELTAHLDRLVAHPEERILIAGAAYRHVARERILSQHIQRRAGLYSDLLETTQEQGPTPSSALQAAGAAPLNALAGWQRLSSSHARMDLESAAEHRRAIGIDHLQDGALRQAAQALHEATVLDPSDPHSAALLGHCLMRMSRFDEAGAAFQRARQLDPLLSRPVRGLAQLHQRISHAYSEMAWNLNPFPAANRPHSEG